MIEGLAHKARRRGVAVYLTGTAPGLRRELLSHGVRPPLVRYARDIDSATATARRRSPARRPPDAGYSSLSVGRAFSCPQFSSPMRPTRSICVSR